MKPRDLLHKLLYSLRERNRKAVVNFLARRGTDMDILAKEVMEKRANSPEEIEKAIANFRGIKSPTKQDILVNFIDGYVLFGKRERLYWEAPPIRAIITRDSRHISKRLQTYMRKGELDIRVDADFELILARCRREETWITDRLAELYKDLAKDGWIFTMGAFKDGELVAGLWGLEMGGCLGLMSLFHSEQNAGSICFGQLLSSLDDHGRISFVDCGYLNEHFKRYGAYGVTRTELRELLIQTHHRKNRNLKKQLTEN